MRPACFLLCLLAPACAPAPDDLPPGAAPGFGSEPLEGAATTCFFSSRSSAPAATIEHRVEVGQLASLVHVRLTLDPHFVDNTYGSTAVGWSASKKGKHTFADLVGSDHAQLLLDDGAGATALDFLVDYISADASAPSGYRSLGVRGGEGKMLRGVADDVVAATTSLDRNLNERQLTAFIADSPATDTGLGPSPSAPAWDFRVVYEAWVRTAAFGAAGFGAARVSFIHASPSKTGTNTENVTEGSCPQGWSPGCTAIEGGCQQSDPLPPAPPIR
jgi:hypothetical protein